MFGQHGLLQPDSAVQTVQLLRRAENVRHRNLIGRFLVPASPVLETAPLSLQVGRLTAHRRRDMQRECKARRIPGTTWIAEKIAKSFIPYISARYRRRTPALLPLRVDVVIARGKLKYQPCSRLLRLASPENIGVVRHRTFASAPISLPHSHHASWRQLPPRSRYPTGRSRRARIPQREK